MATQSSILAWKIPWTEEPGELTVHTHTHTLCMCAKSQTQLEHTYTLTASRI